MPEDNEASSPAGLGRANVTEQVAASAAIVREESILYISNETVIKNSKTRQTRDELPAADVFFGRRSGLPASSSSPSSSLAFAIFEAVNVSDMKKSPLPSQSRRTSGRGSCKGVSDELPDYNSRRDHNNAIVKDCGGLEILAKS